MDAGGRHRSHRPWGRPHAQRPPPGLAADSEPEWSTLPTNKKEMDTVDRMLDEQPEGWPPPAEPT